MNAKIICSGALSVLMAISVASAPVYANDNGWNLPGKASESMSSFEEKAFEQGKRMTENSTKKIQFAGCLAFLPFVGPNRILQDKSCRDSVKSVCRLDKGVPDPVECAVFPAWSY